MKNPTQRFSDRVDNYVRYRPPYPAETLDLLRSRCGLTSESVVADIGSGTGILSSLLLQAGCRVFGVEPNKEMREAAELLLKDQPRFVSVDGTAEATTLPAASIDLVTAAQAFHWFKREQAGLEFRRIARPGAWAAILWNTRLSEETPFLAAYEELLKRYAKEYSAVDHRNVSAEAVAAFFAPSHSEFASFHNSQQFEFEGLAGRLLSSSYAPNSDDPNHAPMMQDLRRLFDERQKDGKVEFLYRTEVYCGRLR